MRTKAGPPPKSAEKAAATGVNSSDPGTFPGDKRPSAVVHISTEGGLCKRARSSSSCMAAGVTTTIVENKKTTLGDDCFKTMLAFLPLDHLVFLRNLSKDTKTKVDEMISKRAKQSPTLDLGWRYRKENNRIRVQQGWTEKLQNRESVIEFAIQLGDLTSFCEPWEVDWARGCLRGSGSVGSEGYDDSGGDMYSYSRKIEWNDALEASTGLKAVTKYFQRVERGVERRSEYYSHYDLWDPSTQAEYNEEVRNMVVAKETALSLLLTNSSNAVSFSKIKSEDEHNYRTPNYLDVTDEKSGCTVLVFRLDNEMEIYLQSSFYDDFTSDY